MDARIPGFLGGTGVWQITCFQGIRKLFQCFFENKEQSGISKSYNTIEVHFPPAYQITKSEGAQQAYNYDRRVIMADPKVTPMNAVGSHCFKEAVCIDAGRVYDSCSEEGCAG